MVWDSDCLDPRPSSTEARTSAPYKLEAFQPLRSGPYQRVPMQSVRTGALRANEVYGPADAHVIWLEQIREVREHARLLCEESKLLRQDCRRMCDQARSTRAHSTRALLESSRLAIGISRTLLVLPRDQSGAGGPRHDTFSSAGSWRPHGDSNPGYRRERAMS